MRSRTARMSLAVLAVALPLLTAGVAHANEESGEQVVFTGGGLLGVACGAKPSVGTVTLPAESTLRVVNQTGYKAKLILDGVTQGEVGKGEAAKILFHHGPVTLALKPNCVLTEESTSVRVSVRAPAAVVPKAAAAPAPAAAEKPAPAAAAPPAAPDPRTPPAATRPAAQDGARPAPAATTPARTRSDTPGGTTESAPTPAAAAPVSPSESALLDPLALPLRDGTTTTVSAAGVAAEPVASVEPVRETGPIGLLALIATICVIGVSAGAIRAIIAQRAARTGFA